MHKKDSLMLLQPGSFVGDSWNWDWNWDWDGEGWSLMGVPAVQQFCWKGSALHWLACWLGSVRGTGRSLKEFIRLVALLQRRAERQDGCCTGILRSARSSRSCLALT